MKEFMQTVKEFLELKELKDKNAFKTLTLTTDQVKDRQCRPLFQAFEDLNKLKDRNALRRHDYVKGWRYAPLTHENCPFEKAMKKKAESNKPAAENYSYEKATKLTKLTKLKI